MEIALGISMTATTVRMVLVEGDRADGLTVECDEFSTKAETEAVAPSAAEQVSAAILATQQSANRQGHSVSMCGIAVSDECDVEELGNALSARGLGDIVVVGERQAAAALARTVARAIGYTKTVMLFVQPRAATMSVVDSADPSVGEQLTRSLQSADANYVLTEMLADFTAEGPRGLFVVDSSGRLPVIKPALEAASSWPIIFSEESEWALARGAALAAAAAERFEASTQSLAYAQDPDEEEVVKLTEHATGPLVPADEVTQRGVIGVIRWGITEDEKSRGDDRSSREWFVPIGSLAASVVVIAAVAVVMALAVSATPSATEHVLEREQVAPTEPITAFPPAPPPTYNAAPALNPAPLQAVPPPAPPPPPPPAVAAVEQAPRTVLAEAVPVIKPQTVQPVAAAQAPVTPKPAAAAPVEPAPEAAPDPVDPPPAAAPIPVAAPAPVPVAAPAPLAPPAPALQIPQITLGPPVNQAPAVAPQAPLLRWLPSFLRPQQQAPAITQPPAQQWTPPAQQWTPPAQQWTPPAQQWTPPAQQWTPPAQQWTPPAQQWTPPAQQWTPPAQQWTPPAQQWTPPAQQWTPPAQQWTPPAQQTPQWPQSSSGTGGFRGGSRYGSGGGTPFWPYD